MLLSVMQKKKTHAVKFINRNKNVKGIQFHLYPTCSSSVYLMSVPLFQSLVNGNINTYLIKGLSPSSEYEVLLAAIYRNEVESDEVILIETTGKSLLITIFSISSGPPASQQIQKICAFAAFKFIPEPIYHLSLHHIFFSSSVG